MALAASTALRTTPNRPAAAASSPTNSIRTSSPTSGRRAAPSNTNSTTSCCSGRAATCARARISNSSSGATRARTIFSRATASATPTSTPRATHWPAGAARRIGERRRLAVGGAPDRPLSARARCRRSRSIGNGHPRRRARFACRPDGGQRHPAGMVSRPPLPARSYLLHPWSRMSRHELDVRGLLLPAAGDSCPKQGGDAKPRRSSRSPRNRSGGAGGHPGLVPGPRA